MADPQHLPLAGPGRLRARPGSHPPAAAAATAPRRPTGRPRRLGVARGRDALLHVPRSAAGDEPRPLVVLLHGAGADAGDILPALQPAAERSGTAVLAPDSRGDTWDMLRGGFGRDVAYLDAALDAVFAELRVDAARIALAGFSDGASYALSLGLANGDLFSHLIAFSPGFAAPPSPVGRPAIYVTHGRADRVLPIAACSRRVVPALQQAGYAVRYEEFDGGHTVPEHAVDAAMAWFLETRIDG